MLSVLGLETPPNAKSSSVSWYLLALLLQTLSSEFLGLCQHCITELSAVVPQLAPKQLTEVWKIDVVIGQYVQDDRLQDTSRSAYTGMDAYEFLQRETSGLCSNRHSLKPVLPIWEDQVISTFTQVQVKPVTHLFSVWRFLRSCFEENLLGPKNQLYINCLMLSVFQRKYMACIFFLNKTNSKIWQSVSVFPVSPFRATKGVDASTLTNITFVTLCTGGWY